MQIGEKRMNGNMKEEKCINDCNKCTLKKCIYEELRYKSSGDCSVRKLGKKGDNYDSNVR